MDRVVEELRAALPPIFAGTSLGDLTGGAIHWPTIQNKRSRREIPEECFVRSGRRVLVRRDPFLAWWGATLTEARQALPGNCKRESAYPRGAGLKIG